MTNKMSKHKFNRDSAIVKRKHGSIRKTSITLDAELIAWIKANPGFNVSALARIALKEYIERNELGVWPCEN